MEDVIANAAALDAVGLALFVALLFMATKPKRRKQLRVVEGVKCWCVAFGAKPTGCYCVSFEEGTK